MLSKRILNIGPLYSKNNQTGGIVVLFENWVQFCKNQDKKSIIIDSNKNNYSSRLIAFLCIIIKAVRFVIQSDIVMLHGTINDYQWIAPIIVYWAHLRNKKIVLRKFAGNFYEYYIQQTGMRKQLLHYVLSKSDILYWETHKLVSSFKDEYPMIPNLWFPNSRIRQCKSRIINKPYTRNFVFLSRVEKEKGIDYLISAFHQMGEKYSLDIYGPLIGYTQDQLNHNNCHYRGVIPSESVNEVISAYDALILPTYWNTEGYPGIIMECYNAGIPVLASRVGGIPELIEDGKNGFLIEPQSVNAIIEGIARLEASNYSDLCINALKSFDQYDSIQVNQRVLKEIQKDK